MVAQVSRFTASHHGELEELLAFLDPLEEDPARRGRIAVGARRALYRIEETLSVVGAENAGRAERSARPPDQASRSIM